MDVITGSKVIAMSHADDLLVSAGRDGWLRMVNSPTARVSTCRLMGP